MPDRVPKPKTAERRERLAEALRANLGRRKEQARARAAKPSSEQPAKPSGEQPSGEGPAEPSGSGTGTLCRG